MNEIVVHGIPGSPFVRAVQLTLEEKTLPYRLNALGPGDLRSEAHLRQHPFGRVPAFAHGDFALYETRAILRYLDAAFPDPALQPTDAAGLGRMEQIMAINDWYFFPKVAAVIVFNRIVGPVFRGITPDEAAIAAAMPMAVTCLAELGRFLGDQPFLVGDRVSLADLLLAPQVDFLAATPEGQDLLRGTVLSAWLTRMNERPSMQRTQRPAMLRGT
jgi:glutathione S-transferase